MKLDIGCGRQPASGFIGIDKTQIIDGNGHQKVEVVMDIEKTPLPYLDNEIEQIRVMNVLEHLQNLQFVLNECWRVLKVDGVLEGCVPVAGSKEDFKDPTHVRHFIKDTFSYFCGVNPGLPHQPCHPKYADYGFKPWHQIELKQEDNLIYFKLTPRK